MLCSETIFDLIMLALFFFFVFLGANDFENRKFDALQRRRIAKREQRRKEWRKQENKLFLKRFFPFS